jgi:hypothetical protein
MGLRFVLDQQGKLLLATWVGGLAGLLFFYVKINDPYFSYLLRQLQQDVSTDRSQSPTTRQGARQSASQML